MPAEFPSEKLNAIERRAAAGLAAIFSLRMLGMFIILPVFALYAASLPGGTDHTLIGIALGAYGLTQAALQIPFGWLSDKYGRKRVLYFGLLLFAGGSLIAAASQDIYVIIFGRVVQGAGAVSAVVIAMLADLTREEHRTKAMALIGATIGVTFGVSFMLAPFLNRAIGVPGIFALTGVLAILAMAVVKFIVPDPSISHFHSDAEARPALLREVWGMRELQRLNVGIFALHACLMALFIVVPFALNDAGIAADHHWQVYLPVMLISFLLMLPPVMLAEAKGKTKPVFIGAIILLLVSLLLAKFSIANAWGLLIALTLFFTAFNILEANLPSLISRIAPVGAKGTASGIYSSLQFLGTFVGAAVGGWLSQHWGMSAVMLFCAALVLLWLAVALGMQVPAPLRSRSFHAPPMEEAAAKTLGRQLLRVGGVREAIVIADEGIAILKTEKSGFDEQAVLKLLGSPDIAGGKTNVVHT
ncbi:MAG: MFS transporter [Burkholderiales bacterium]